jgi:hypothetical protein
VTAPAPQVIKSPVYFARVEEHNGRSGAINEKNIAAFEDFFCKKSVRLEGLEALHFAAVCQLLVTLSASCSRSGGEMHQEARP